MTRQEFLENVTTWESLIEASIEEECYVCEDILFGDELDEWIESDIEVYQSTGWSWENLRNALNEIDTSSDRVYSRSGWLNYTDITDCFTEYFRDVLAYFDVHNLWEEDGDEDEPAEESEEEPEEESTLLVDEFLLEHAAHLLS